MRDEEFLEKKCQMEHYESPLGGWNCMLWVGVDGWRLCGNHQNVESSGTRCYLKPQEKEVSRWQQKKKNKQLHVPRMQRVYRDSNLQLLQIQYVQIDVYCNQDLIYRENL